MKSPNICKRMMNLNIIQTWKNSLEQLKTVSWLPVSRKEQKARRENIIVNLKRIIGQATLANLCRDQAESNSDYDEVYSLLQMMTVYFVMSMERGFNNSYLQKEKILCSLESTLFSKKKVYRTLKKIAVEHTMLNEKNWAKLQNLDNLPVHDYLVSFLSNWNFWVTNSVPIRVFVTFPGMHVKKKI
jgi:hypothetical protein